MNGLETGAENTWCPGCGNFGILTATKQAISELISEGYKKENFVIGSGIGCHAKIVDYINVNSFYSIHGRVPPTLTGMKLANKELVCIGFSGDGDGLAEGISHLIHAAKRNTNITMILHNNGVFALTTGQFTPTSKMGFKGRSTPIKGNPEHPINPLTLMLTSGATFVARGYAGNVKHLKGLIKEAVNHQGFSFIEVLQPCVVFHNTYHEYNEKTYVINNLEHNVHDYDAALKKSQEFNEKIPIGVFYKIRRPTYEEIEADL